MVKVRERAPRPTQRWAAGEVAWTGAWRRLSAGFAVLGLAGVLAACGGHRQASPAEKHHPTTTTTATTTTTTTTTRPAPPPPTCPLTDLPAPGGKVPPRPALAVKVDNLPQARPPYGLGAADVVYEEPVEGGVTRFIAIYQCHNAPRIEPVRSARFVDPDLIRQFGAHPLFGFAGAIPPVVSKVDSSSLIDVNWNRAAGAYWRDPKRLAPHNLVTSTAALYAAGAAEDRGNTTPPSPVFNYGPLGPHGPAAAVHIDYPLSDLVWTWEPKTVRWFRSYAGAGPATLATGGPIATANIVVMRVVLYPSPYVDTNGVHQNLMVLTGSGPAQVFRSGAVIDGRWERPSLDDVTKLVDSAGHPIALARGPTWIELVPSTVSVTVTP